MRSISKKDKEPDSNFTAAEVALLSPTTTRIVQKIEGLSSADRLHALGLVLAFIRRKHDLQESLDLFEFVLGECTQEQHQIAA